MSPKWTLDEGALGPTAVDVGAATGRCAIAAVDVSPAMLAHVRAFAPSIVDSACSRHVYATCTWRRRG